MSEPPAPTSQPSPPERPPASADIPRLPVVEGTGQQTVLFLHGLAGHCGEWAASAAALGPGFLTIRVDQRGHGLSDRADDLTRQAFRDDVIAVVEAHGGQSPVTIVGQSMGAHTALLVAAHRPDLVEHLVLVEGDVGGGGPVKLAELDQAFAVWPESFASREDVRDFFGWPTPASEVWADGFAEQGGRFRPRFDPSTARAVMAPVMREEHWEAWNSLAARVDLVLAERSDIDLSRIERMCVARPSARRHTVQNAGHDLHLDQPQRWARLLRGLLHHVAPA